MWRSIDVWECGSTARWFFFLLLYLACMYVWVCMSVRQAVKILISLSVHACVCVDGVWCREWNAVFLETFRFIAVNVWNRIDKHLNFYPKPITNVMKQWYLIELLEFIVKIQPIFFRFQIFWRKKGEIWLYSERSLAKQFQNFHHLNDLHLATIRNRLAKRYQVLVYICVLACVCEWVLGHHTQYVYGMHEWLRLSG